MLTEPRLDADLVWIWDAWNDDLVDSNRQSGFGGVSTLSWSEVSRWCEDNFIFGEQRLRFIRLIRALDRAFCAHITAKKGNAPSRT